MHNSNIAIIDLSVRLIVYMKYVHNIILCKSHLKNHILKINMKIIMYTYTVYCFMYMSI